jgi:hypothetical protein
MAMELKVIYFHSLPLQFDHEKLRSQPKPTSGQKILRLKRLLLLKSLIGYGGIKKARLTSKFPSLV